MIPFEWSFACLPSFGFRSTRYGANAPGQPASIIATSMDDDFCENARTSCEYDASEAAGCGTTFTLIPVSFVKRVASSRSRLCELPTESPTNVIFWPLYFFFSAAAPATLGGFTAAATERVAGLLLAPPAVATLSETTRANTPASPANTSTPRCLTCSPPFRTPQPLRSGVCRSAVLPAGSAYHCGGVLSKTQTAGRGHRWPPPAPGLAVGGLRGRRARRSEVGRVGVRVVAVREPGPARARGRGRG